MSQKPQDQMLAILFAAGEPIAPDRIANALELTTETVKGLIEHLNDTLEAQNSPLQVLNLNGQYQLATRGEYTHVIKKVMQERRNSALSQAALEVLAAIAYNQPVTRAYVEQVRGVDSNSIVTSLAEKGLIEEAGRLEVPGKPIAYRTTAHFLRTFGLSTLDDLPLTVEEITEEVLGGLPEALFDGQVILDNEIKV